MRALTCLAVACLAAGPTVRAEEAFDLGPLAIGMELLKVSTRDLRVKAGYVDDAVGGGDLRLPFVADGLAGVVGWATGAQALGSNLTQSPDAPLAVEALTALLGEGRVTAEAPAEPLNPQAPLAAALRDSRKRGPALPSLGLGDAEPSLPLELREALAELIYGAVRADEVFGRALKDLPPEDVALLQEVLPGVHLQRRKDDEVTQALRAAARLDMRAVVSATAALTASVTAARKTLSRLEDNQAFLRSPTAAAPVLLSQETDLGPVTVAGTGPNVHSGSEAILVDLGGADRYEMSASQPGPSPRVRVVVDLGGDDTYSPTGSFGPSAALLGLSILVDEGGDDDYTARDPYAFGAALAGAGLLIDAGGNDRYMGVVFGEGAALFGLGLLLDGGGDDAYEAELYAQGFGSVKGVGALIDAGGTDRYLAGRTYPVAGQSGQRVLACAQGFGLGMRPPINAPGGIGILADAEGKDTYTADTYSQGAAWWFASGLLFDREGDDQYQGGQYSQGAGGFLALGALLDEAGHDRYSAAERGQGFGLERGVGLLRDASGDDGYAADRLAQGAAMSNGIAVALDLRGEDAYLCREEGQGFVPRTDAPGTLALFGDGQGADSYAGRDRNDLLWSDGWLGLGLDTDGGDPTRMRADLPAVSGRVSLVSRQPTGSVDLMPIPGEAPPPLDLEARWSEYLQATDGRGRREALWAFESTPEQAIPYLVGKLSGPDEEQLRAAQDILAQIGTAAVPELLRLMDEGTEREARVAMAVLTMIGDPRAAGHLARQAKSPRWRTRAAAAGGMGEMAGEDTRLVLEQLLRDPDEDVRRGAVVALRRRAEIDSAEAIAGLLGDPVYAVRTAAADALVALVALGARCPTHVFSLVGSGQYDTRLLSIETCGRLGSREAGVILVPLLASPDWADRAFAAEAICRIGDPRACEALRAMLANETNGLVQAKARTAMRATRLCEP
ncbi:MAG: HEAT repeat domain-containing protein [Armatimonadetes bacterium]|nr:HEAT repeat domain-containing protein [Armatimonadota bacterium]